MPRAAIVRARFGNAGTAALLADRAGVRPKLEVGAVSDPLEREADATADKVVRMKAGGDCAACARGDPCDGGAKVRRASDGGDGAAPIDPAAETSIRRATSGGEPLPGKVKAAMEPAFGADFSGVRVHRDAAAADSAHGIGARAYTVGNHIAFGRGQWAPGTDRGDHLIAHELTHTLQDGGAAARRVRRQVGPQVNPVLSIEDMFGIITRERAFTFSPGGTVCEDPAGIGRGVGPAAGGRRAGYSVFAVIQVVDADGRPVALSYGQHLNYGDPHAEEGALRGLRREIPPIRDVSGGTMTVVLDQAPCPPGRRDCMGGLRGFARQRGLNLDVRLPTRPSATTGAPVSPRTAARGSQRMDMPRVTFTRYDPGGGGPPGSSGPVGAPVSPVGSTAPRLGTTPGGAPRIVPPQAASPAIVRQRATTMATLARETQRSVQMSSRVSLAVRGFGALMSVLSVLATLRTAQAMATRGTLFGDAEDRAAAVEAEGQALRDWAVEATGSVSLLEATMLVGDARDRGDPTALFELDGALSDIAREFDEKAVALGRMATDLRAREAALRVLANHFGMLVSLPQGPSTAPNAEAFAMHESCQRLAGRMGAAAAPYAEAETQLRYHADWLSGLATQANRAAWANALGRIAALQGEIDRDTLMRERLLRERRMNELAVEVEAIDAQLDAPVCFPEAERGELMQRRAALVAEAENLRATMQ
jgi:hypothetical protein